MRVTRRHLIATSGAGLAAGGAATALAACGADGREDPSAERDVELLQRVLTAESAVGELYGIAEEQRLGPRVGGAVERFAALNASHLGLLRERIAAAGGTPDEAPGETPPGESAVEALRAALNAAIGAGHGVVGGLSTEDARRAVYRVMIDDAAQLAVFRGVLGEEQVPVAFVTGAEDPPLAVDPDTGVQEGGP